MVHALVILELGRRKQVYPWGLPASQPRQIGEPWVPGRFCLKKEKKETNKQVLMAPEE